LLLSDKVKNITDTFRWELVEFCEQKKNTQGKIILPVWGYYKCWSAYIYGSWQP